MGMRYVGSFEEVSPLHHYPDDEALISGTSYVP